MYSSNIQCPLLEVRSLSNSAAMFISSSRRRSKRIKETFSLQVSVYLDCPYPHCTHFALQESVTPHSSRFSMSPSSPMSPEQPQLSPEYLAEDRGRPLFNVSVAFIVLETLFFAMFVASRFVLRNYRDIETWCFMPLGYLFGIALCCLSICESFYWLILPRWCLMNA